MRARSGSAASCASSCRLDDGPERRACRSAGRSRARRRRAARRRAAARTAPPRPARGASCRARRSPDRASRLITGTGSSRRACSGMSKKYSSTKTTGSPAARAARAGVARARCCRGRSASRDQTMAPTQISDGDGRARDRRSARRALRRCASAARPARRSGRRAETAPAWRSRPASIAAARRRRSTTASQIHISRRQAIAVGRLRPARARRRARASQSDHGSVSSGTTARKNHHGCALLKPPSVKRSKCW